VLESAVLLDSESQRNKASLRHGGGHPHAQRGKSFSSLAKAKKAAQFVSWQLIRSIDHWRLHFSAALEITALEGAIGHAGQVNKGAGNGVVRS
jgi:hypothetical protein